MRWLRSGRGSSLTGRSCATWTGSPRTASQPATPPSLALLLGFGEDAVNLELRFVVDFGQGLNTKDEVQMAIERSFQDEGIEFALPTSKVRLTPGTPSP